MGIMNLRLFGFLIVFVSAELFGLSANAQKRSSDALTNLKRKEAEGKVIIEMDSLILANYNKFLVQNKKNEGIFGYRIRIFSDNGIGAKEKQRRMQAKFLSLYPDIKTDPEYEGSYYKIYVGNYRTKRDAQKMLDKISKDFPDAFIIEDKIVLEE